MQHIIYEHVMNATLSIAMPRPFHMPPQKENWRLWGMSEDQFFSILLGNVGAQKEN
jgi:hypothetical protein